MKKTLDNTQGQGIISSNRPLWSQWKPTSAMPGTTEKMVVIQARIEARVPTSHPLDADFSAQAVKAQIDRATKRKVGTNTKYAKYAKYRRKCKR